MKTIELKPHLQLDMTLGQALQKRRSNRDCQTEQLNEEALSTLLWACAGISDEDGRRTVPSTLDLRAVTPYVLRALMVHGVMTRLKIVWNKRQIRMCVKSLPLVNLTMSRQLR